MDYAAALTEQNYLLGRLLLDADWSTPVPTCPGWSLLQLLRHVGRGDRWAAQIIQDRADSGLDPRLVRDGRPSADAPGAIDWLHQGPRTLLAQVEEIGADTPVWTFLGPRPTSWWIRRRLHEAAVHRSDAAVALGTPYELSAELAADGITEWLDRLVTEQAGGRPTPLPAGTTLSLRTTEDLGPDGTWTVHGDDHGVSWSRRHEGRTSVELHGPAAGLFLSLVRRKHADEAGCASTVTDVSGRAGSS